MHRPGVIARQGNAVQRAVNVPSSMSLMVLIGRATSVRNMFST